MEEYFGKNYELESYENYQEFLEFMNISLFIKKLALALRPTHSVAQNDDGTYTMSFRSKLANFDHKFKLGEEFLEKTPNGKNDTYSTITFEDNKVIQEQRNTSGRTLRHVFEHFPDKMILTTAASGFNKVCIRTYKAVA